MPWKTFNKILGLAMTDRTFAEKLLKEPEAALDSYGILLEEDELRFLCTCQAQTLQELSQQLIKYLGSE